MRRLVALIAMLLCALAFPAAATEYGYVIAEGDLLGIGVWGVKELTFQSKVRLDGKITVPGVGEVDAAGMTPAKLQAQLARDLMPLVKAPLVTVEVKESAKNSVFLFGTGAPTHSYQLDRRTSLLQMLSALPDLKNVDFKKAYLVREGKKLDIDIYRLFILGDPDQDS